MIDQKLAICAALSVVAHFALARGLDQLPKHDQAKPPERITVRVIEPDPPKEPPKPPEPIPEPPKPLPVATVPRTPPAHAVTVAPVARDAPPPDHTAVLTSDTTDSPVFGVTMESTSQQGGPAVAVGNTLKPAAPSTAAPASVKPAAQPVAAFEATKLPVPQGRCFGKYTDEARAAGLEGTVVLDLTVDAAGHARDIAIVQGLDHGLGQAAVAALLACRFSPGERDGKTVPVRIRGFKIQFVLQDAN